VDETLKAVAHEACARAAHEVNRTYALALADNTHQPWETLSEELRESTRAGVKNALAGSTPEKMHASWLAARESTGWTYGPVRDEAKKTNPCMVPYAELPPAQRAKDRLFLDVVTAVATAFGLTVPQGA